MKRKLLWMLLSGALALSSSLTVLAAGPGDTQPAKNENTQAASASLKENYKAFVNLPETVHYLYIRDHLIKCAKNGNPTAKYVYNMDNTLRKWYSYEYNADGCLTDAYYHINDNSISWADSYKYEYDSLGNLTTVYTYQSNTNQPYVKASYHYGADGRLASSTEYSWGGEQTIAYEYDANGNLIGAYGKNADGSVNSESSTFQYDSTGRLTREDSLDYVTYEYDANGNLAGRYRRSKENHSVLWGHANTLVVWSNGRIIDNTTTYGYDSNGNRIAEYYYDWEGSIIGSTTYEYDANGNLTKETVHNKGPIWVVEWIKVDNSRYEIYHYGSN